MLTSKTTTKEKSVASPKPESKKGAEEEAAPQLQLNPLWHSLATHVGCKAAAGALGDPPPNQTKPSSSTGSPPIQRMCTECEEALDAESEMKVQTKLTVGAPDDPYEKEADAVADKVMRMPAVGESQKPDEQPPSVQRKSYNAASQPSVPNSIRSTISSPGSGSPLHESVRSRIEPVVGADLSHVRVHVGEAAQDASRNLNARAFTHQNNIYLGRGQSTSDVQLMAHEATHTVQQSGVSAVIRRDGNGDENAEAVYPPPVSLAFSLAGINMLPRAQTQFRSDITARRQYAEMLAAAIAGEQYSEELGVGLHRHLDATQGYWVSGARALDEEGSTRDLTEVFISLDVAYTALDWLYRRLRASPDQAPTEALGLAQERIDLILLGVEVDFIWRQLHDPAVVERLNIVFPEWYTLPYFRHELSNRREALLSYREHRMRGARLDLLLFELADYAMTSAAVLEIMREYTPIYANPVFRSLWDLDELAEGEEADGPSASQAPNLFLSVSFITFSRSQPGPMERVIAGEESDPDPRQELWDRFQRWAVRATINTEQLRDQVLSEGYSDRNASPLPADLSAIPALSPPFFDIATNADHAFVLDVSFSDVYEALANAFGGFAYIFETIRVDDDSLNNVTGAAQSGSGEVAGWGQVWRTRMSCQGRYLAADLETAAEATIRVLPAAVRE